MFLRRVIRSRSCPHLTTDGLINSFLVSSSTRFECGQDNSVHHIHVDSRKSNVSHREECPVVACDLQRLLAVDNRFDLYHFLNCLIVSERFNDEVKRLVGHENLAFSQVLTLVDTYSWNQRKEGVDLMQVYAEKVYPKELAAQGNFVPHKLLCDKLIEPVRALNQLLEMASARHLKAVVLAQAELFMNRIISRGSRSVVDKVNEYLVRDCSSELKGPLLCSSWISFYLSPYDGDRVRAANLLKGNEKIMQPHLDFTLTSVAQHLLAGRQLNRYYALLEVFSKRSHRAKTKDLLERLFHHFYETNNLRGCLTCESLARELNVDLPHDVKFKCGVIKKSRSASRLDMKFVF